jgi:hypothetical protein
MQSLLEMEQGPHIGTGHDDEHAFIHPSSPYYGLGTTTTTTTTTNDNKNTYISHRTSCASCDTSGCHVGQLIWSGCHHHHRHGRVGAWQRLTSQSLCAGRATETSGLASASRDATRRQRRGSAPHSASSSGEVMVRHGVVWGIWGATRSRCPQPKASQEPGGVVV